MLRSTFRRTFATATVPDASKPRVVRKSGTSKHASGKKSSKDDQEPNAISDEIKVVTQSLTYDQIYHPAPVVKVDEWRTGMQRADRVNTIVSFPKAFMLEEGVRSRLPIQARREVEFFQTMFMLARDSTFHLIEAVESNTYERITIGGLKKTGKSMLLFNLACHYFSDPNAVVMYVPAIKPFLDGRYAFERNADTLLYEQPVAMQENLTLMMNHNNQKLSSMNLNAKFTAGKRSWSSENSVLDLVRAGVDDLNLTTRIHAQVLHELFNQEQSRLIVAVDEIDTATSKSTAYRDTESAVIPAIQLALPRTFADLSLGKSKIKNGVFIGSQTTMRAHDSPFIGDDSEKCLNYSVPNFTRAEVEEILKHYTRAGLLNRGEVTPGFIEKAIFLTECVPGELFRFCTQRALL